MESRGHMKVTVVVTKVVETNADQFKSVVQNLTGKDSAWLIASDVSTNRSYDKMKQQSIEVNNMVQNGDYVGLLPTMEELFEFWTD
jgi:VQ motif